MSRPARPARAVGGYEPAHRHLSSRGMSSDSGGSYRERVDELIGELRDDGLLDDEIRRLFEAGLLRAGKPGTPVGKR